MSVALAPCPFCGDVAEFERTGTRRQSCIVQCTECGTRHESSDEGERSGTSWNRRAADAEIARLTAELAAARAVPPDVEASKPATVGGLLAMIKPQSGRICESPAWDEDEDSGDRRQLRHIMLGTFSQRIWSAALGAWGKWCLVPSDDLPCFLHLAARLVPAHLADADPATRGPIGEG